MRDIFMDRNGRTEYTREDIFNVLKAQSSAEFGYYRTLTYNIHIDDEGNILNWSICDSEQLVYELNYADYGLTEEEWDSVDCEYFYANETWDCEAFVEAVDGLTKQVNQYLKEIDG